jgi:hypothetical protein
MGWSRQRKTGLTCHVPAQSFKGYTLIAPIGGDFAVLLDMDGRIVHRWSVPGYRVFQAQLLSTGNMLALCSDTTLPPVPPLAFDQPPLPFAERVRRLGGGTTDLRELDWDGELVWEYRNQSMHHDVVRQSNGHTLVAEWVELPTELSRQVRGGARRPREKFPPLISDDIVELDATGQEKARIHLWQLLDPVRDPICPLEPRWEWTHLNSLALMPNGDLLFSCRNNSRVGIVERAIGKLRWKYGAGQVVHQHHATAVGDTHVQIFDNGMHRIGLPFSRVVEVNPADDTLVCEYTGDPPEQFFSAHISGAERQPNGNVLICEGASGRLFEVTPRGETVWEWVTPFTAQTQGRNRPWIFRAHRYPPDHPALASRSLDPAHYANLNRLYGL